MKADIFLSVIVPVYNEEDNIRECYRRLTKVLTSTNKSYEIIFINDGSTDRTQSILVEIHQNDERIMVINFIRNFGQTPAIMAGIDASSGEYVLTIDADLQSPPEEITKLVSEISKGYDLVYGTREHRDDALYRKLSSRLLHFFSTKLFHIQLPEDASSFRILKREMVENIKLAHNHDTSISAITAWLTDNYKCIPTSHVGRAKGKTKYNFFQLIILAFDRIVGFSKTPLRWIGSIGIIISFSAIIYGVFLFFRQLIYGTTIPGFTSLFVAISFLSGLQLISLSVMGEYIGRIFDVVQNRPFYIIKEKLDSDKRKNK